MAEGPPYAPPNALLVAIRRLAANESLDSETITQAFNHVMRGDGTPAQIAALLMALRVKGETATEVAGVARAMREVMHVLPASEPHMLVDTCGTGGGALTTFNISTAAALLAAGMGVRIAKHGNRSFTSRSGSADVLEALGVAIDVTPEVMLRTLNEAGIVFMFAPLMHPAMRHVGPIRSQLTIGTVMNVVGPLANPARAGRQVVGVAEPARLELLAGTLAELGTHHALVVHGEPGLDEVSPLGTTSVVEIRDGKHVALDDRSSHGRRRGDRPSGPRRRRTGGKCDHYRGGAAWQRKRSGRRAGGSGAERGGRAVRVGSSNDVV